VRLVGTLLVFARLSLCFAQAETKIRSDSIGIVEMDGHMFFSFSGNVVTESDKFELFCDQLEVITGKEIVFLRWRKVYL
jgi:hypothetical protein